MTMRSMTFNKEADCLIDSWSVAAGGGCEVVRSHRAAT